MQYKSVIYNCSCKVVAKVLQKLKFLDHTCSTLVSDFQREDLSLDIVAIH